MDGEAFALFNLPFISDVYAHEAYNTSQLFFFFFLYFPYTIHAITYFLLYCYILDKLTEIKKKKKKCDLKL